MRSLKRKVFKGSAAGIILAALIGTGTAFGVPVLASETQENAGAKWQSDCNSDTYASAEVSEGMENTGGTESADDTDSVEDAENENEGEETPSEDQKADETAVQSSGVSEVKVVENKEVLVKNVQTTPEGEGSDDAEKNDTVGDEKVKNGWIYEDSGYKYYKNGAVYTGWHYMGAAEGEKPPHWSYFADNGLLYTGWHYMGAAEGETTPHWSYFGGNGWLRTGWEFLGAADGEATPHWSFFGENGWLRTGWKHLGTADGEATPHWSYFGDNGWLRTGWVMLGKGTSNPDGNNDKHWSYFGKNGWLRTGWVLLGKGTAEPDNNNEKHWSYFGENGWLRTRFQEMGTKENPDGNSKQHLSYFGENGWLVTSGLVTYWGPEDYKEYRADSRGWLNLVDMYLCYADGGSFEETTVLEVGEMVYPNVVFQPDNDINDKVKWTNSNPSAVSVSAPNGYWNTITAKKPGTSTITIKSQSGRKAVYKITVVKNRSY